MEKYPTVWPVREPETHGLLGLPEKVYYPDRVPGTDQLYIDRNGDLAQPGWGYAGDPPINSLTDRPYRDKLGRERTVQAQVAPRFNTQEEQTRDYRARWRRQVTKRIITPVTCLAAIGSFSWYAAQPDDTETVADPISTHQTEAALPSATPSQTPEAEPSQQSEPVTPTTPPLQPAREKAKGLVTVMQQNAWGTKHPGAAVNWEGRADTLAEIAVSEHVDFLHVQEAQPGQIRRIIKRLGSEYKHFPGRYIGKGKSSQRTIFYRAMQNGKELWHMVRHGRVIAPAYNDRLRGKWTSVFPYGIFKNMQTEQTVADLNVHPVAWDNMTPGDSGGALKREKSGIRMADWAHRMKQKFSDALVIIAGDFNDRDQMRIRIPRRFQPNDNAYHHDRSRKPVCRVGQELTAIDDQKAGRTGDCPPSRFGFNLIYTNAQKIIGKIKKIDRGQGDHDGIVVTLQP